MKKIYLILAAAVGMTITSCTTNDYLGEMDPNAQVANDGAIRFGYKVQGMTRAGELTGATAADMLGGMFVVEGTKGSEQTNSPSTTVVFDNYLVGYDYNSAATTESNTNNWEYVNKQTGISGRMSAGTWSALHAATTDAKTQTIKYWDYTVAQYDFIAWSTGEREAITATAENGKVQVTRIAKGTDLATAGFTLTAWDVDDLMECYYTDINTVKKDDDDYGKPVTLTFRNMATKVRVALYETIPGYSVKSVKFYSDDPNPTAPEDLGETSSESNAVLFTTGTGTDVLPQSGEVVVYYPHIGSSKSAYDDYNKASVTVNAGGSGTTSSTQTFGALTANYITSDLESAYVPAGQYLGRTLPTATFAGEATKNYYTPVFPNTNGKALTLRVDYTLVSIDGSAEEINVYGAKAVVPATYTVWQPNYAYTYVFKISDNTNGWTSKTAAGASEGPKGLFPITFDAVVTSFVDVNAEQTTVTTVATPSITTYQQGHTTGTNEYSKAQTAGASSDVKKLYVQVMDNSGTTSTLKNDLSGEGKSLLFSVSKANASEAEVMDALQNRTNTPTGDPAAAYNADSPVGRNGITLTKNTNIVNNVTSIVNGVDDMPITVGTGTAAEIAIASLATGTYAYVYCTTVPSSEKKVYNVVSISTDEDAAKYYEIAPSSIESETSDDDKAKEGKVYFIENLDAEGHSLSPKSYTFVQTEVGVSSVAGLFEATISAKGSTYTAGNFYFDVYYQNTGSYAVKVIKVVD